MNCSCGLGKTDVGQTSYFAVMVPQGLYAVALISDVRAVLLAAWYTSEARGRDWVPSIETAWEYLHATFGDEVEFKEVSPIAFRKMKALLRPPPAYTASGRAIVRTMPSPMMPPPLPPTELLPLPPSRRPRERRTVEAEVRTRRHITPEITQRVAPVLPPPPPPVYEPPPPPPPPAYEPPPRPVCPSFPVFDPDNLPQTRPAERYFPRRKRR